MTEIREPNFGLDLPGVWEQGPIQDDETLVFVEETGIASISVTLLGVRPMFEIADKFKLLEDYMAHRQTFEAGQAEGALGHSQPKAREIDGGFEGEWSAEDAAKGRLIQHRVLLVGSLLADFAFEMTDVTPAVFAANAGMVLRSATATP
jgi:hypothetical protein